jgi:hypothetical protein
MKNALYVLPLLLLAACAGEPKSAADSVKKDTPQTDSVRDSAVQQVNAGTADLQLFSNIEIVDFSVPVPLNEYKVNYDRSDVKAKFVFEHVTKKDNEIVVQGLLRGDESVSLADYCKNTFAAYEEGGKIIQQQGIVESTGCFYAKGYWNNKIYDSRFIEVIWLRKTDLVRLEANFDIADTSLWNERLVQLLKSDSKFKE